MMSGGRGAGGDYDQITHTRMLEAMLVYSSVGGALAAIMIRLHMIRLQTRSYARVHMIRLHTRVCSKLCSCLIGTEVIVEIA